MNRLNDPESELRNAIRNSRALIVCGTGVSLAASRDPVSRKSHPQASWMGLLENGLEWLQAHQLISADLARAHLTILRGGADIHHLVSAAQDVTTLMGGPGSKHFADWLERTIGTIKAHDREVLDSLEALRKHGSLLATTNYDDLLLDDQGARRPVTWRDGVAFLRAARNRETDKVVFLHGHWRKPESVILDWTSYQEISRDERYRQDVAAVWQMTTWVYVGCGVNGLSDPDLGLLIERYGKRAREAELWDFCLVPQGQREEFQARFDKLSVNICAISFGDGFDQLARYLRLLVPAQASTVLTAVPGISSALSGRNAAIPSPPDFYAEPHYIGSHHFVGREAQLQELCDWAESKDRSNLLLIDAIGGNGKSMLTWEWITRRATSVGPDWAGRFWYSFYERGAVMADFCRRALAYMTDRPLQEFAELTSPERAMSSLLSQLHARPWLLVLDGLERVLVAYHRFDAAEVLDEQADCAADKVLSRNPCDTVRDEDSDLLRALAAATPSKILVSSRLVPRVWMNRSDQPIPGVHRMILRGLCPADAEQLLRSCGIEGDSAGIQDYLTRNCDNHPLVIGVLGGLIANYLPCRSNFDAWSANSGPDGGARLRLADLDLNQRRNHILRAALDTLPEKGRQLLSTLALLSDSADHQLLQEINPHLPPRPEEVRVPEPPEKRRDPRWVSSEQISAAKREYDLALVQRRAYEEAVKAWDESAERRKAPLRLTETVKDLEQRGLLQYDRRKFRYDLHPVVRGVANAGMKPDHRERFGQRVVDHFSSQPRSPYNRAKTLEDVARGLDVVRVLLRVGRLQEAAEAYRGDLASALIFNLEAHVEILSLLRPFFPSNWDELPTEVDASTGTVLANDAAIALSRIGAHEQALAARGAILNASLSAGNWTNAITTLHNISESLTGSGRLAKALRANELALSLAELRKDKQELFMSRLALFFDRSRLGQWDAAEELWHLLNPMGRNWQQTVYHAGVAEFQFARAKFWQGALQEHQLSATTNLAEEGNNRSLLRSLHVLHGAWRLERREWELAAASFQSAISMARERRFSDETSEAGLLLARLHLGQFRQPEETRQEAERLAGQLHVHQRYVAMIWQTVGDVTQAAKHALAAYRWAWADGEPYVYRYELTKATELLREMNVPVPRLRRYDPRKDEPLPWETTVQAAIARIHAQIEAEKERS